MFREKQMRVLHLEITRASNDERHNACAIFALRLARRQSAEAVLTAVSAIHGVVSAEEL